MGKKLHECQEFEERSGMIVGLPRVRYNCPCGHTTEWNRSQYEARKDFQAHANQCDTALWLFFPKD